MRIWSPCACSWSRTKSADRLWEPLTARNWSALRWRFRATGTGILICIRRCWPFARSIEMQVWNASKVQQQNREQFTKAFAEGLAVLGFARDSQGNGSFLLDIWDQTVR